MSRPLEVCARPPMITRSRTLVPNTHDNCCSAQSCGFHAACWWRQQVVPVGLDLRQGLVGPWDPVLAQPEDVAAEVPLEAAVDVGGIVREPCGGFALVLLLPDRR